ncbi:actin-binding protein IPP-like [Biomphalaria glabrata]|uniref:Actin-binding protein IPP-like n=1 Tax=Biomphalaria glabrata TaxID=6526 RepID=A0A9W3BDZ0_BIOGL|nr:actin-binding protein IPP-like [Biomphalaria glabrata]XP_055897809.1 actin-binding protein IPP-like [Biomphalaria glabrata]
MSNFKKHYSHLPNGSTAQVTLGTNTQASNTSEYKQGVDHERSQNLLKTAWKNFQSGHYTDVKFIVDKRTFHAHRLVLVSLSDYFTPLFKFDEKGNGEIILQNVSSEDFEILLKYAYTGQVDVTPDNVQSVLIAADYLSIEFVKRECITYMKSLIDVDNVCDVLVFSINYTFANLQQCAEEFLKEHLDSVSKTETFSLLDPEYLFSILNDDNLILYENKKFVKKLERESIVFKSVLRYLTARLELNQTVFELLLTSVRLPELSNESIKRCLKEFKDMSKNETVKRFLKLNEIAVKCIDKRKRDHSFLTELAAKAKEVPETWFRPRKLSTFNIISRYSRYAAGGEVKSCPNPPMVTWNDPYLEIQSIDLWIRLWDERRVIGGLKILYRKTNSQTKPVFFKGSHQNSVNHHFIEFQPHELITKVIIGSGWLVDRLGFETNLGRTYGPYGGPGGSHYEEVALSSPFSYLYDINCESTKTQGTDAIFNLMLRWIEFH